MKVTVCELDDKSDGFEKDWQGLAAHVKQAGSDLVLLPEMPFYPWPAWTDQVDPAVWEQAVQAHEQWLARLQELAPAVVLGSRPVLDNAVPHNEAFVWEQAAGSTPSHRKYYLPEEEGFWEASWYRRGKKDFQSISCAQAKVGFLLCTEMWFTEHARAYARQGIELLACPRATELSSLEKWVAGGRAAAVMSGSYCLSSNRSGENNGVSWGGGGWVIDPDGQVLGVTHADERYLTREIDLAKAAAAKQTYPRYVKE